MSKYEYEIAADDKIWGVYLIHADSDAEALEKLARGDFIDYTEQGFCDDSDPSNPEILSKVELKNDEEGND